MTATPSTTLTGRFVDAAVAGIGFRTESQTGTSDAQGQFAYRAGESVTFAVGGVSLPAVPAASVVTLLEMGANKSLNDPATLAIAQFLQALDANNAPADGISVDATRLRQGAATPNWSAAVDFSALFSNPSLVPSKEKALMHLANSLTSEAADAKGTLVGRFNTDAAAGVAEIITYHEASKSAFIAVDNTATRPWLKMP